MNKTTSVFLVSLVSLIAASLGLIFGYLVLQRWRRDRVPQNELSFFVQQGRGDKLTTFAPQGWGWPPNDTIELAVIGEPSQDASGHIVSTQSFHNMGTVTVDSNSLFGFNGRTDYNVAHFCGTPPAGLANPLFRARDSNTGVERFFYSIGTDGWFSFVSCR